MFCSAFAGPDAEINPKSDGRRKSLSSFSTTESKQTQQKSQPSKSPPSAREKEETEEVGPRTAISSNPVRISASPKVIEIESESVRLDSLQSEEGAKSSPSTAKAEQKDPLVSVLNQRLSIPSLEQPQSTTPEEESGQADPRAALLSELCQKSLPQDGELNSAPPINEEEEQADPRAALMSMLSKRVPPSLAGVPKSTISLQEEPEQLDPGAALKPMPSKKTPPQDNGPNNASPTNEVKGQADPRPALMSMLSKRIQSSPPGVPKSEKSEHADPMAPLTATLNDRTPPKNIELNITSSTSDEERQTTKEAEQDDPRAALMLMLSKRAAPKSTQKQKSIKSLEDEGDQASPGTIVMPDNQDQADPGAGPMLVLSKHATPQFEGEKNEAPSLPPPSSKIEGSPQTPSPKPVTKGFFPATSPNLEKEKLTARGERYETKTSSNARENDVTPALLASNKSQHQIIALPDLADPGERENHLSISDSKSEQSNHQTSPCIETDTNTISHGGPVMASSSASKQLKDVNEENTILDNSFADKDTLTTNSQRKLDEQMPKQILTAASAHSRSRKARRNAHTKDSETCGAPIGIAAMAAAAAINFNERKSKTTKRRVNEM